MRLSILSLASLAILALGCERSKPLEVTERGWIIGCSDASPAESSSHGNPWVLFTTKPLGVPEALTLDRKSAPPCSTWRIFASDASDLEYKRPPDYALTRVLHVDWLGRTDGTWDIVRVEELTR